MRLVLSAGVFRSGLPESELVFVCLVLFVMVCVGGDVCLVWFLHVCGPGGVSLPVFLVVSGPGDVSLLLFLDFFCRRRRESPLVC